MDNVTRLLMQGAAGAAGGGTYVDDVFSSYLYKGTGATQTITNEIDLSGEGGLVWIKNRTLGDAYNFNLYDTERGATKFLVSNANDGEDTSATRLNQFNNNGFRLGGNTVVNASNKNFISWNFRKAPGFFDVVTYTGTGSARTVAHNLGSVPGCIMIKRTDANSDWVVYHRAVGPTEALRLDSSAGAGGGSTRFNDTAPTASVFTVGTTSHVNANGGSYVAYIFAGGESTAATARSVDFNGSSWLDIADHSDFTFGTDDFTIEAWYKADDLNLSNSWDYIFSSGWPVQLAHTVGGSGSRFTFYMADSNSTSSYIVSDLNTGGGSVHAGQWYHVAVTRSGSTFRIFLDGVLKNTATSSGSAPAPNANSAIGRFTPSSPYYYADGKISNFRYVKGTAVYTSSFRPPTAPLTNITNTKLLCCNSSSVTGSTVTPGTITNNGSTASTESPFDDLEGFKFGEEEDQSIIKMGTFVGNGNNSGNAIEGPLVDVGFEPQWVLTKTTVANENWNVFSSITPNSGGFINFLCPNASDWEGTSNWFAFNSRGFQPKVSHDQVNKNGATIAYIAIRRPDGLVGKPAEVGSAAFNMDPAGGNNAQPTFDLGFAVDANMHKQPAASTTQFMMSDRLRGGYFFDVNSHGGEQANLNNIKYDYMNGMGAWTGDLSSYQAWGWKRGAGFDVVIYAGNGTGGRQIAHNLGRVPEMMWVKNRTGNNDWRVYHSGMVGGYDGSGNWNTDSNPAKYQIYLNKPYWAVNNTSSFNETQPTSTVFTLGTSSGVNASGNNYVNYLFSSVAGISKVGSYTGSSSALTITTGFSPRFVIIKNIRDKGNNWTTGWFVFDTTRGWAVGDSKRLRLNDMAAQTTEDWTNPISTGFAINASSGNQLNNNGEEYIYYAHA